MALLRAAFAGLGLPTERRMPSSEPLALPPTERGLPNRTADIARAFVTTRDRDSRHQVAMPGRDRVSAVRPAGAGRVAGAVTARRARGRQGCRRLGLRRRAQADGPAA